MKQLHYHPESTRSRKRRCVFLTGDIVAPVNDRIAAWNTDAELKPGTFSRHIMSEELCLVLGNCSGFLILVQTGDELLWVYNDSMKRM